MSRLLTIIVMLFALTFIIFSTRAPNLEKQTFDFINLERANNGLVELQWDDEIAAIARQHSQNMADKNFFSHDGFQDRVSSLDSIGFCIYCDTPRSISFSSLSVSL